MKFSNFRKLFLSSLMLFILVSCNKQRTVKEYYEDGSLKHEFQILNNEPHGFARAYYSNGKPKDVSYFQHGKITGKSLEFFENGNLYVSANYFNGKKHGLEFTYNKTKGPISKINWIHGKPEMVLTFTRDGDTLSYSAIIKKQ